MDTVVVFLVLASAALHPLRDLILKENDHRESAYLGIAATWIALTLLHAAVFGQSLIVPIALLPMIAFSALGLVLYYVGITVSLRHGEFSVYYPIIRSSPLFVVAASFLLFGQRYESFTLAGIALAVAGAFFIQYRRNAGLFDKPLLFTAAFVSMTGQGILTLADAQAMKAADPAPFLFWVYGLVFVTQAVWFGLTKPGDRRLAHHLFAAWRRNTRRVLLAGVLSYLSYVLVLNAFQLGGEAAAVSAVRQASVPVSVLLGAWVLHETRFARRLGWSLVLTLGIVMIVLSS